MTESSPIEARRSFERIDDGDLTKLCDLACQDTEQFLSQYPKYKTKTICIALCQGAALHYVDGQNGVKDFDVWTFYAKSEIPAFPVRRLREVDFGISKFGKSPDDITFVGRRVDLLGRSIEDKQDPVSSVRSYLAQGRTHTAFKLSQKPVVILFPKHLRGEVVWPVPNAFGAHR